jgi:hypothetical protein
VCCVVVSEDHADVGARHETGAPADGAWYVVSYRPDCVGS